MQITTISHELISSLDYNYYFDELFSKISFQNGMRKQLSSPSEN